MHVYHMTTYCEHNKGVLKSMQLRQWLPTTTTTITFKKSWLYTTTTDTILWKTTHIIQ